MRLKAGFLFGFVFVSKLLLAQTGTEDLVIRGITPDLYLIHTVKPKENMYSIGRNYNISPKDIAAYNKMVLEKPIAIGQTVKIPLTTVNFHQSSIKPKDDVLLPVYYLVQDKEWLYRISANHNKVPAENLQSWNRITSTAPLKTGTKLVVGYLKVKNSQPILTAANKSTTEPQKNNNPVTGSGEVTSSVKQAGDATKQEKPSAPVVKKEEKLVVDKPQETAPSIPVKEKNETITEVAKPIENNAKSSGDINGGYFKSQYSVGSRQTAGVAGVFKSVSGWRDGKYYVLINNVSAGTIVKITAPSNGKSIYAKVLGALPEMRESVGLIIRLSDAAANELGASNSRFNVEIKY